MSAGNMNNIGSMSPDWQINFKTVKDRSRGLYRTMKLSDCSFRVGAEGNRKVFEAHKLILSMASPVFEVMFYGSLAEKEYPIDITDVEPEAFQLLLEYIYTDRINVDTFDKAVSLCYAAQKYMFSHVADHCIKFVTCSLNAKNACRTYEFAKFFDQFNLQANSMKIIRQKAMEILNGPDFIDCEMSTVMEIIDKDGLNITSELALFNALERYVSSRCVLGADDNIDENCFYRQAVKKIRFLLMTPTEFAAGPANSKLLLKHEKLSILLTISSGNVKEHPMPEGFSTSITKRCRRLDNTQQTIRPIMISQTNQVLTAIQRRVAIPIINPQTMEVWTGNNWIPLK